MQGIARGLGSRQCGETVGISVDYDEGSWDSLLSFAHDGENLNIEALDREKFKRKGSRELKSLACSTNYENSISCPTVGASSSNIDRRVRRFKVSSMKVGPLNVGGLRSG